MRANRCMALFGVVLAAMGLFMGGCAHMDNEHSNRLEETALYSVDVPMESRSVSFENPTGAKGEGAKAASNIGVGRKGMPAKVIQPGQTETLCDMDGPGVIRHIWLTTPREPANLMGLVIRAYWEGQEHPSIEAPVGCFFGFWNGREGAEAYESAVHSINPQAGMNIWAPMPFTRHARFTITNEGEKEQVLFYNMDYTIGDRLPESTGRMHVLYRRENPTTLRQDFEILPRREGMGRFLGCVLGVRTMQPLWFGEGEFKVYLDGDTEFPTIAGTGVEDYVTQSWGLQVNPQLYAGTFLHSLPPEKNYSEYPAWYAFYRWHYRDPIYWKKDIRVTIQQIGWTDTTLLERQDDWTTTTFWYEPTPSAPLPPMPDYRQRIADTPGNGG